MRLMKQRIENFYKQDIFNMFHKKDNPFSFVTTRIDITNIYKLCQEKKHIYATMGYYLCLALNEVEEFKYRFEENNFYKYDKINPSYTEQYSDGTIGFFTVPLKEDYEAFIEDYIKIKDKFLKRDYKEEEQQNVVWLSCEPWFNFTSVISPYEKDLTIPQLIWDKFIFIDHHVYTNLMIMSHHGFVDGAHIGQFLNHLNEKIKRISRTK